MRRNLRTIIFLLLVTVSTGTAVAQGKGQGKGKGAAGKGAAKSTDTYDRDKLAAEGRAISAAHERIIREWFSNSANLKGLPPGLAKREQLPPGLQRQLARNGTLPPGLQKKLQPLPRELELRLPRLPDGRRRIVVANNVILLEERTASILDILTQVF
jgi:hypothetical protein